MKIVQVQTQAEAAGAQRVSDMVAEGLRRSGHQVRTVFMYRKTDAYDANSHADFILPSPPQGSLGQLNAALGLITYLRKERPDAVLCYQYYGVAAGVIGARFAGARRILANQSGAPQSSGMLGLMTKLDKLYGRLGLYDYSITNSAWTHEQFASYPDAYRRRLRRIDHGVLGPQHSYDKAVARQHFGMPADALIAVSSGRITRDKNQSALVRALGDLPHLHVAVAGAGPERDNLLAQAERLGAARRLHLVGELPQERLFEFLAAGDIFVFPTLFETFGLAAAEAAIAGVPVIANDLSVLREVLSDQYGAPAALFVEAQKHGEIATAVARLTAEPELRAALIGAGQNIAARYSVERMCTSYEALLG